MIAGLFNDVPFRWMQTSCRDTWGEASVKGSETSERHSDPFTYSTRQHLVFTIGDHEQDSAQMQRYGVHNRRQVPAQFGIVLHRGWLI